MFNALTFGFLFGVGVESLFSIGFWSLALVGGFAAVGVYAFRREFLKPFFAAFGVFLLGAVWFGASGGRLDQRDAWIENGAQFSGRADVLGDPELRNGRLRVVVRPEEHDSELLLWAPPYPRPERGGVIVVAGTFKKVENFTEEFDYVSYLRAHNILYELSFPQIDSIEPPPWHSFSGALGRVRNAFLGTFRRTLPEPHASLLGGITIGAEEGLDDIEPDFRAAGVSHITVLSGYNITVVSAALQALVGSFGFWPGVWAGGLGVVFFTLMAGLGASAVRAACMALLALFARASGREYDATRALTVVVFFMVLQNPRILVYDISFQLSVLATLGILYGPDRILGYVAWIPERFGLREAATTTLAAQLFVVPFVLYIFGTFSLVSLPANIAILPFVPPLMFFGSFLGIVGFISSWVALVAAYMCYLLLSYILNAAEFFAAIPFASVSFGRGSVLLAGILYGILAWKLFPELWKRKA